jgi:glycosyltransferase involved in cell wall biosynthesis
MNIGYDAKRAFQNKTGLGNYSRSLINILSEFYPQHQYTLFAPKQTDLFDVQQRSCIKVISPKDAWGKRFPSLWRRRGMVKDIISEHPDIFHGLSNELPSTIEKANVKKIVTVQDLIFERYPETYNFDERYVHRWKIKQACRVADVIIAISKQTKDDLVNIYGVAADKIQICYQSCNPIFEQKINDDEKKLVKQRYGLPDTFFLFISAITKRKNLITICKAMQILKGKLNIPLVIIGDGKKEKDEVKEFMKEKGLADQLLFLNELPQSKEKPFVSAADFPAIYQQALALIYPSIFEGYGQPVLEALWSGVPVICSDTSSLPEAGGDAALYFSPYDTETLAKYMQQIAGDKDLRNDMREKGFNKAHQITPAKYGDSMMRIYESVIKK